MRGELWREADVEADAGLHSALCHGLGERRQLRDVEGDGLLDDEMLPGARRSDGLRGVQVAPTAQIDDVDVRPRQQSVEVSHDRETEPGRARPRRTAREAGRRRHGSVQSERPASHGRRCGARRRASHHREAHRSDILGAGEARPEAVAQSGVKTCVCFNIRFSPQFASTRSLLAATWLGSFTMRRSIASTRSGRRLGSCRVESAPGFRRGGSGLLFGGLPLCRCPSCGHGGSPVEEVSSYATNCDTRAFARYEYPTASVTILRFANGAVGKVASVINVHGPCALLSPRRQPRRKIMDGKLSGRAGSEGLETPTPGPSSGSGSSRQRMS